MNFNSIYFFIFIFIFFLAWPLASRKNTRRWLYIVIFSFVFYGWWDWRFLFLLVTSGVVNYYSSILITSHPQFRKFYLIITTIINLGLLSVFKYAYFFCDAANWIFPQLTLTIPENSIILPVGISFYTFQAMSYSIDVYRGRITSAKNLLHFFAYLTMFPQLVAGPIVRASEMLRQLEENKKPKEYDLWQNYKLVVIGYFQKVVIADNLAPFVNTAFSQGTDQGAGVYWWIVMVAFSFQIYCDFSGYSNIARGIIGLMGYRVKLNFNHPYIATSMHEFWTRWHISLSSWFRDYVYITLGGNRSGKVKAMLNLWLTMLLSGLWHGAGLNFVCWGAIHALYLTTERITNWPARLKKRRYGSLIVWCLIFIQVVIAWVFFRAESFNEAIEVFKKMFFIEHSLSSRSIGLKVIPIILFVFLWETYSFYSNRIKRIIQIIMTPSNDVIITVILATASVFLRGDGGAFIYFQF